MPNSHPALVPSVSATSPAAFTERRFLLTLAIVISLFMLWGIAITMGDVLNRHFQNVLHVSKAQSGLVQFSIFGAYAVMAVPAGRFMQRFGYKNGVLLGLGLYALGAFLFVPAANAGSFVFFRLALFVLACGLATLETVAHPFVAALGDAHTSAQRLNFAQGFNGLGGVIGPVVGGFFILRAGQQHSNDLESVKLLYEVIGTVILALAVIFGLVRVPTVVSTHEEMASEKGAATRGTLSPSLLARPHFLWAVAAQFSNVAAQCGVWAFFINYGIEKVHLLPEKASYYFAFSMFLLMVGRFVGTLLMRFIAPNKLLAGFALGCIAMCLVVAQSWGWASFVALLLINFFLSIMFPTIFSLGLKGLGERTQQGSSFLVMAVVGGAVFPPLMGLVADHDIARAYYLPIICYAVVLLFGARFSRVRH